MVDTDGSSIELKQFNTLTGDELLCDGGLDKQRCSTVFLESWGDKFSSSTTLSSKTTVVILNGKRFGIFQVRAQLLNVVQSVYNWETLLSSAVVLRILFRWMLSMFTLHRGYKIGVSQWHSVGLRCLANCPSFRLFPLLLCRGSR